MIEAFGAWGKHGLCTFSRLATWLATQTRSHKSVVLHTIYIHVYAGLNTYLVCSNARTYLAQAGPRVFKCYRHRSSAIVCVCMYLCFLCMNVLYTLCCSYVMYIKQNIIPFKSMILFSLAMQVRLYQGENKFCF